MILATADHLLCSSVWPAVGSWAGNSCMITRTRVYVCPENSWRYPKMKIHATGIFVLSIYACFITMYMKEGT
jgi:hypothetical protein